MPFDLELSLKKNFFLKTMISDVPNFGHWTHFSTGHCTISTLRISTSLRRINKIFNFNLRLLRYFSFLREIWITDSSVWIWFSKYVQISDYFNRTYEVLGRENFFGGVTDRLVFVSLPPLAFKPNRNIDISIFIKNEVLQSKNS